MLPSEYQTVNEYQTFPLFQDNMTTWSSLESESELSEKSAFPSSLIFIGALSLLL